MSLSTWKKAFYTKAAYQLYKKDDITLVEYCLRKWEGLRKINLDNHNLSVFVKYDNVHVGIGGKNKFYAEFYVDDTSCALCAKYPAAIYDSEIYGCENCPLFKYLGEVCDSTTNSPYQIWRKKGDPEPMIKALTGTLKMLKKKKGTKNAA